MDGAKLAADTIDDAYAFVVDWYCVRTEAFSKGNVDLTQIHILAVVGS